METRYGTTVELVGGGWVVRHVCRECRESVDTAVLVDHARAHISEPPKADPRVAVPADMLGDRPPTLSTEEAAGLLGVTPYVLYKQVKAGTAPIEPIRLGRLLKWPTKNLLDLLGLSPDVDLEP